jgi:hypothetical protein
VVVVSSDFQRNDFYTKLFYCKPGTIHEMLILTPIPLYTIYDVLVFRFRVWTTEKEINIFSDWNISGDITQSISSDQKLVNVIPFQKGGSLSVVGSLDLPSEDDEDGSGSSSSSGGIRTEFEFTSAKLDLAKWGTYNFPPVGKGWFDTIYLDEDLRVDVNSRNDILICTPFENDGA